MGQRRRSREIALQVLYEMEVNEVPPEEALRLYYECFESPLELRPFCEELVYGVYHHRAEIDRMIGGASQHWRIERMSIVDRNILRLALYEMLHCRTIPPKVSINEAIDLGKMFGSNESGAFINGILDHVLPGLNRNGSGAKQGTV
ncbi:transcription antitermination factor NusB [Desulfoferrobacter suflitae]|uniref:transcription antitermination factor NusB n=1 Tax=Desulfoferrobacter suflitae TaxID=2865782 RepID=UPI00216460A4|nr:transcription antitermination factor NusB [Desulfoferrobacter suflitae]MCK8601929.1 transcription antitermination factor NusB [Desulfoferrobacter suflitae]